MLSGTKLIRLTLVYLVLYCTLNHLPQQHCFECTGNDKTWEQTPTKASELTLKLFNARTLAALKWLRVSWEGGKCGAPGLHIFEMATNLLELGRRWFGGLPGSSLPARPHFVFPWFDFWLIAAVWSNWDRWVQLGSTKFLLVSRYQIRTCSKVSHYQFWKCFQVVEIERNRSCLFIGIIPNSFSSRPCLSVMQITGYISILFLGWWSKLRWVWWRTSERHRKINK